MSGIKKLYRSQKQRVFYGVLGGLGEYFEVDPVLLRVFWAVFALFSGIFPGVIAYLAAALIISDSTPAAN